MLGPMQTKKTGGKGLLLSQRVHMLDTCILQGSNICRALGCCRCSQSASSICIPLMMVIRRDCLLNIRSALAGNIADVASKGCMSHAVHVLNIVVRITYRAHFKPF